MKTNENRLRNRIEVVSFESILSDNRCSLSKSELYSTEYYLFDSAMWIDSYRFSHH